MKSDNRFRKATFHYHQGIECGNKQQFDDAIEHFQQAIKLFPNFASAHANLGVIYNAIGFYIKAIDCLLRSIEIKPDVYKNNQKIGDSY
jgi:protein O-mannosyl-transferase